MTKILIGIIIIILSVGLSLIHSETSFHNWELATIVLGMLVMGYGVGEVVERNEK